MAKYRVLSIDGGGIRGLIPTILLQRITASPGLQNFLDTVDLIAGTSTGGLLALAIASGLDLDTIENLYVNNGPEVFDDSWLDDLVDLGSIIGADYDIEPLQGKLEELFGNTRLGDLKKRVLITAFDLDNEDPTHRTWKPKLFHNFPGPDNDSLTPVAKVGLYTCAAPTYFPSVDGYIDGGVYANNPAMCALAQTQDRRSENEQYKCPSLDEVILFSLGTGKNLQYIEGESKDWGYAQWAEPLIHLMLDGITGIADYQCKQILGERYHRLEPVFPPGTIVRMDDVSKISYMVEFAIGWNIDETVQWLNEVWNAP